MVFRYKAQGSGAVIETQNPIIGWGQNTTEGAEKPPLHRGEYDAAIATHKHPAPKGERDRYDDRLEPRYSVSGANYAGFDAGPTAAPGVTAPSGKYSGLNRGIPRGIPDQDRFNRGFGRIGSGEMGAKGSGGPAKSDRGVRYTDGDGNVKFRGRSG